MIDVFSLLRLSPGETIQRVYRSHPIRLLWRLVVAALFLALPFFFLFDFSGRMWGVALALWASGFVFLWLALDVWSSSLVIVTSHRLVGATRERWGRVRIHEWLATGEARVPLWASGKLIPWLGRWEWSREGQAPFILDWAPRPKAEVVAVVPAVAGWRRRLRLARALWRLAPERLQEVEECIDAPPRT